MAIIRKPDTQNPTKKVGNSLAFSKFGFNTITRWLEVAKKWVYKYLLKNYQPGAEQNTGWDHSYHLGFS